MRPSKGAVFVLLARTQALMPALRTLPKHHLRRSVVVTRTTEGDEAPCGDSRRAFCATVLTAATWATGRPSQAVDVSSVSMSSYTDPLGLFEVDIPKAWFKVRPKDKGRKPPA